MTLSIQWSRVLDRVDPDNNDIVVVDIGGTHIKLGWLCKGVVQSQTCRISTDEIRSVEIVHKLAQLILKFTEDTSISPSLVITTIPGLLDLDFDTVLRSVNIPQLNNQRVGTDLGKALGVPVVVEHDVALLLQGECSAGCAANMDHVMGIFFGTGIAAAFFSNGEIFRGGGWALEIGQTRVRKYDKKVQGLVTHSLEDLCSGIRLQALATEHSMLVQDIFNVPSTSARLKKELEIVVEEQALAISAAIAYLSPAVVVVGGGLIEMEGYPWHSLVETVYAHAAVPEIKHLIDIRQAELGWNSVLHGALALAQKANSA